MKINKHVLKKIILGEVKKVSEARASMSDEDLMDYSKACPQGWKDADCMVDKILHIIDPLFQGFGGDPKELQPLKIELEEALLDMALGAVPDDDQGEGDELNMVGRFNKKGSRDFGGGKQRDEVENTIEFYSTSDGSMKWRMAENDFVAMACGHGDPGVKEDHYKDWTEDEFKYVLKKMGGTVPSCEEGDEGAYVDEEDY